MSYIRIEAVPPTPYGLGWFYVEAINGDADEQYVGNLSRQPETNKEWEDVVKGVPEIASVYKFQITEKHRRICADLPRDGYMFVFVDEHDKLLFGVLKIEGKEK
jgi:hypothetical protein